jgi:DNA-binding GntR family transcriptional regulator
MDTTLAAQAYDEIKRMILGGELKGGERMSERDLTGRLKVSRTPLREALKQLTREGLVVSRPQSGHYVRTYDLKTVDDLYGLREILEAHAITLALSRMDEVGRRRLRTLRRDLRKYDGDAEQSQRELDESQGVHVSIARLAGDAFLLETLLGLYDRLQLFVWIDALYEDDAKLTRAEHRRLLDAMIAGRRRDAIAVARGHARRSHANVRKALLRRPSLG